MEKKIRTIFMGTPELAASGLKALLTSGFFDVSAVISKVDSCSGRNMQINKSAVKLLVEKYNKEAGADIQILQPEKIKEILEDIKKIEPELIVVIAYGKILPKEILAIPKYGCINIHASLLPKYRGSACIAGAILNGDKKSGITIMKMDEGMDTGDIIEKLEIELEAQENSTTLMEKTIALSSEKIAEIIKKYIEGKLIPQKQNEAEAIYVKMIKKEDGHLDFKNDSAETIERKIRAYYPWPGTYAFIEKEDLPKTKLLFKIQKSEQSFLEAPQRLPGEIFVENGALWIKAQDLAIRPEIVQLEGKKALSSTDFLKGNAWIIGKRLE